MKKLVSILLMCGMVSTMVASSCWASDSALNGVVSKLADEVVVEKLTKTEAQNNYSDNYTNAKPTELSQNEISANNAYFKKLAEKSGKPEDDFVKGKFEEFKEKLSGINRDSLKEFIKKHGLKVALAVCAVIAAVCGGVALKKLNGANSVTKASCDLVTQPTLGNVNNENYVVFDNIENKATTVLSEESSSKEIFGYFKDGCPIYKDTPAKEVLEDLLPSLVSWVRNKEGTAENNVWVYNRFNSMPSSKRLFLFVNPKFRSWLKTIKDVGVFGTIAGAVVGLASGNALLGIAIAAIWMFFPAIVSPFASTAFFAVLSAALALFGLVDTREIKKPRF